MDRATAIDVPSRDVPADRGSVVTVLLSRSRLAERMKAFRADGQRLFPDGFQASANTVEPAASDES
jgi:hypothetical protein